MKTSTATRGLQRGEYLGFEIRHEADETVVGVPNFKSESDVTLLAQSVPKLRKRIWQWWHMVEVAPG